MKKTLCLVLGLLILAVSCKKPIPEPVAAELKSPEDDLSCLSVSLSTQIARVAFKWLQAEHTDDYTLVVENLKTGERQSQTTKLFQQSLSLAKGAPYSWKVISSSEASPVETESETRRFYLEGPSQFNYIPFPADLVAPEMDAEVTLNNGATNLSWVGADLDDDIASYAVYIGTSEDQLLKVVDNLSATNVNVDLEPDTFYFWRVATTDALANTSTSAIFRFYTTP